MGNMGKRGCEPVSVLRSVSCSPPTTPAVMIEQSSLAQSRGEFPEVRHVTHSGRANRAAARGWWRQALWCGRGLTLVWLAGLSVGSARGQSLVDVPRELQLRAVADGRTEFGRWGPEPGKYISWSSHSLRIIPVYTFGTRGAGPGIDLEGYQGEASAYRSPEGLQRLYGQVPPETWNPEATYLDQTDLARIQRAALKGGKKQIVLVVFDGMDWQTTRAAAIWKSRRVGYREGRGTGLHFQDYQAGGTTQYGGMITAPQNDGSKVDVNTQQVINPGGTRPGGYSVQRGGPWAWSDPADPWYIVGKTADNKAGIHPYPDSAATATAMCAGVRSYNEAINVDSAGRPLPTVAHEAQQAGLAIGVVTSVPVSHATPACAYAHNVSRDDYQDISRDLLGRTSIQHGRDPLPGVDVLLGGGYGDRAKAPDLEKHRKNQGENFEPTNLWLADSDLEAVNIDKGGRYVVAQRTPGRIGSEVLAEATRRAIAQQARLLGFFGNGSYAGHLPFRTADGSYDPVPGKSARGEQYLAADVTENPTLPELTAAALSVLSRNPRGFWLMVEAGDVDWANHDNNLDNSIGAVLSGDAAVRVVTDWVEQHSNWDETVLIVTADHGHYLVIEKPELLSGSR